MNKVVNIFKPEGVTPLELIEKLRAGDSELADIKIGYVGRLDPMASGVMILLLGDENKKFLEYKSLDKEYEFEILFGVRSDSYDVLGLVGKAGRNQTSIEVPEVESEIGNLAGKLQMPLPVYSSKKIRGKALFEWAREGLLDEIDVPSREVVIFWARYDGVRKISAGEIKKKVIKRIMRVGGDFRQRLIVDSWRNLLNSCGGSEFCIVKARVSCSSGTYIRAICNMLGESAGAGAIAWKIERTRVGEYLQEDSLRL